MRLLTPCLLLLTASSGCLHEASHWKEHPPQVAFSSDITQLEWNDCSRTSTFTPFTYGTNLGQHPPGWEPSPLMRPISGASLEAWDCERVHWGPFERPLRMIMELHDNFAAPNSCLSGTENNQIPFLATSAYIFSAFWVNDEDMRQWLESTYGLPTYYSPIEWIHQPQHIQVAWNWNDHANWIKFDKYPLDNVHIGAHTQSDRIFWHNETAASYIDLAYHVRRSQYGAELASGEVYPPLLSATYSNHYAGNGWVDEGNVDGNLHQFEGFDCAEEDQ